MEGASLEWADPAVEPPFPENVLRAGGSACRSALASGETVVVSQETLAEHPFPEGPYVRRRGGVWWFLPTAEASPSGVAVLTHPDGSTLEDLREPLSRAVRLLEAPLALEVMRRDTERRIEERTVELTLFNETSRALAFARTAEEVSALLGQHLGRALDLDLLALLALHTDRDDLYLEVLGSPSPVTLRLFRRRALKEARAHVGKGGRPLFIRVRRPGFRPAEGGASEGAEVHIPLLIQGRAVGFLAVSRLGGPLDESHLRLLYTVASQAAMTLERVRSVEEAGLLKMAAVLDSMSEGVLFVDRNLRIILANPSARRHAEVILGRALPRRLVRLGAVPVAPVVEALATGGKPPEPVEIQVEEPDRLFQLTASPAYGLRGAFEGAVLVVSDVTEQRRFQERLNQSDKLSSLGEMISGVAHELNNPLGSIIGFAQLLDRTDLEPTVAHKVSAIRAEAGRCHNIVGNLLRFARHEAPERRPVDLNSVIGSVVQLLGYQLQVDDIALDVDLDSAMRPVLADFHALQQVFVNLVHNAHQAMREKGGRGLLRIVSRCEGQVCRAEVIDTGPGVHPDHLKRIFDPFFSTKRSGQGTGLGLSIAYGTLREYGGDIHVRSRLGRGACFVVELPACCPSEIEKEAEAQARVEPPPVFVERPPGGGRRILVVDDEEHLTEMLREALTAEGHDVDSASDGITASALLRSGHYDVIISDLRMPNMDGRSLYEAVSIIDPALARRIIFSTGDSVSSETQAFFKEVGNRYLTKPFNLDDLYRVVNLTLREA